MDIGFERVMHILFCFIILCYIFFLVNVALSILSKSNLHPFCI